MRAVRLLLLSTFLASCPEQLGDRCGPSLPPCPSQAECVDSRCRWSLAQGGGSGGGTTGPVTSGGASGGGTVSGDDSGVTDGGVDAGLAPDAGRVITVIDLDLYVQPDGGTSPYPKQGAQAVAVFFLVDGGELRLTLETDGGGLFSMPHAPSGVWLAEVRRPSEPPVFLNVLGDQADLSRVQTSGRPGVSLSASLALDFQLTVSQWEETDSLELISEAAGTRIVVNPAAASGTTLLTDTINPVLVEGSAVEPADDLLISQLHNSTNDAGLSLTSMVAWGALTGLSIPGSPIVGMLSTPAELGQVGVRLNSATTTAALGGPPTLCSLAVFKATAGPTHLNAATLFMASADSTFSADLDFRTFGVSHAATQLDCQVERVVTVPSIDGGVERNASGVAFQLTLRSTVEATDRVSLDGGLATEPVLTPPSAIVIDNRFEPSRASVAPTISWTAQTGPLDRFLVSVTQVSSNGSRLTRSTIATFHTQQTRVRLPLGLLISGKTYSVTIQQVRAQTDGPLRPRYPIQRAIRQAGAFLTTN